MKRRRQQGKVQLSAMRSRNRQEKRLLQEQGTLDELRHERREQATLGAQSNVEIIQTKAKLRERSEEAARKPAPKHIARPGKPLKRPAR